MLGIQLSDKHITVIKQIFDAVTQESSCLEIRYVWSSLLWDNNLSVEDQQPKHAQKQNEATVSQ
jgi:hypothetical protein